MQEVDPAAYDIDDLVDLRDVTIDRSLPLPGLRCAGKESVSVQGRTDHRKT